jgi:hypothetical protein
MSLTSNVGLNIIKGPHLSLSIEEGSQRRLITTIGFAEYYGTNMGLHNPALTLFVEDLPAGLCPGPNSKA